MKDRLFPLYRILFALTLFFPASQKGFSQSVTIVEKGAPHMTHFSGAEQAQYGKVWAIASATNGLLYMAAEKGLLEYDGAHWLLYRGSAGFTRSIAVANDSILYSGSDLDFGVWKKIAGGRFEYLSLYPYRTVVNNRNEEFWHTLLLPGMVVFASKDNIYLLIDEKINRIEPPGEITGCLVVDDRLYVAIGHKGLYVLEGSGLVPVGSVANEIPLIVKGMFRHNGAMHLVSQEHGLFVVQENRIIQIQSALSALLAKEKVFSFTQLPDNSLIFGTIFNGLYCATPDGKVLQHINKLKGLPNNTVLSLHYGNTGRLWMGLDVGVSAADITHPTTYFKDYAGEFGTARASLMANGQLYLGTNQGLFVVPWEQLNGNVDQPGFSLVPDSYGQVWTLQKIGSQLLMGHDKGLFDITNGRTIALGGEPGVWTMTPTTKSDYLLTGQYNGIGIYKKQNSRWVFQRKMSAIAGSCNQLLLIGDSVLWVNIPNYGVIKASLNAQWEPIQRQIFPDSLFAGGEISLRRHAGQIIVLSGDKAYSFDEQKQNFSPEKRMFEEPSVAGVINKYQQPILLDSQYSFFPIHNGFSLRKNDADGSRRPFSPMLRAITALADTAQQYWDPVHQTIPYRYNDLEISVVVPQFPEAQFCYRFGGSDSSWSTWQTKSTIELHNLREGKYTLEVRAHVQGELSEVLKIPITIAAPWYRSWYGYMAYILIAAAAVGLARRRMQRKLHNQRRQMLYKQRQMLTEQADKHRQQVMLLEQEKLLQEKEQLSQQLKAKTIELATKAKENVDKAHLLEKVKATFEEGLANPARARIKWAELQRLLDDSVKEEDQVFAMQMDELHQEFFKSLRERFDGLSVYDLRLCAYLKIGLSSAEIADLLKVQPSSVYISRSRLRKKLNLGPDEDLNGFLNKV